MECTNNETGTAAAMTAAGSDGLDEVGAPRTGRRRSLRHVGRGGAFLVGAVMASVVSAVAVSATTGSFSDVPTDHPFAEDIEAVSDACIAAGYDDGTYKPSAPVSRQAMAAFINRAASKVVTGTRVGGLNPTFGQVPLGVSPAVPVAQVVVTVPDLPGNCFVPVEVHGQFGASLQGTTAQACNSGSCQIRGVLTKNGTAVSDSLLMDLVVRNGQHSYFSTSYVFLQQDGTSATYALAGQGYDLDQAGASTDPARNIFAVIHPMDATASGSPD